MAQPPQGKAPLTLTLALEGASVGNAAEGVRLTLPGGRGLVYHLLHITDAAGQVLDGALTVANGPHPEHHGPRTPPPATR